MCIRDSAITIHHTATSNTYTDAKAVIRNIQNYHQENRGWCDIGYHFLIDKDGLIYEGRPVWAIGAHVKNHNTGNIGISVIGNYEEVDINEKQLKALVDLVSWLVYEYKVPLGNIKGHRDYSNTLCPGKFLYARLPEIRRRVGARVYGFGEYFGIGVWWGIYSDYWSSNRSEWEKQVEETLAFLKDLRVDTVFFLVKDPWGYVYYNSSLAPLNPKYSWDPIKVIIEKARKYNISVHVYLNVFAEGGSRPSQFLEQHLDWALRDENGNPIGWVDPSVKEYRDYVLKIIEEILDKYNVDGIQLDRIRVPSTAGRFPVSEKLFKENQMGAKSIYEFVKLQIDDFVKEVYNLVKKKKPGVRVSAAVIANPETALENLCQDWGRWIREQFIDFVVPMSYTDEIDRFKQYVSKAIEASNKTRPVYMGIGVYLAPSAQLFGEELKYLKNIDGIYGAVLFHVDTLVKNKELWKGLKDYINIVKTPSTGVKEIEKTTSRETWRGGIVLIGFAALLLLIIIPLGYKLAKAFS
mgnify:CR=1 FL=1